MLKIGDVVRVLDGNNIDDYYGGWCMDYYVGVKAYVSKIGHDEFHRVYYVLQAFDDDYDYGGIHGYYFDERGLQLIEHGEILMQEDDDYEGFLPVHKG